MKSFALPDAVVTAMQAVQYASTSAPYAGKAKASSDPRLPWWATMIIMAMAFVCLIVVLAGAELTRNSIYDSERQSTQYSEHVFTTAMDTCIQYNASVRVCRGLLLSNQSLEGAYHIPLKLESHEDSATRVALLATLGIALAFGIVFFPLWYLEMYLPATIVTYVETGLFIGILTAVIALRNDEQEAQEETMPHIVVHHSYGTGAVVFGLVFSLIGSVMAMYGTKVARENAAKGEVDNKNK
jgi:hypothetical protein